MIVVNFKAYQESTGQNALKLAKVCEEVSLKTGINIVICPNTLDLAIIKKSVKIDVYAQHVDPIAHGNFTGYITAEHLREIGIDGVLLNEVTHKMKWNDLVDAVSMAKEQGLGVIIAANDINYARKEAELFPNEIALELPDITDTNLPISRSNLKTIREAIYTIGEHKTLIGNGIKTVDDIKTVLELGAKGIVISSNILAINPYQKLLAFAQSFI